MHGGARQGAGRKPKADEAKLVERLDAIIDSDTAIAKLGELVAKGDMRAIQLYLSYRYGCLLYTSPSPRDVEESRMPSSA